MLAYCAGLGIVQTAFVRGLDGGAVNVFNCVWNGVRSRGPEMGSQAHKNGHMTSIKSENTYYLQ